MKTIVCLVAMLGLAAVGCGNNTCEDAVDKLEECDVTGLDINEDDAAECNSDDECAAECINDASCTDINAAFMGTQNSFLTCISACGT